jgi:membrane fusion protein, multidrug efflux system
MASNKLHTVIAVAGIALLGAGAWFWQNGWGGRQMQTDTAVASRAAKPGAGGAGAASGPAGRGGAAPVEVGVVEMVALSDDAQAVGSLRSRQGIMLKPEVSGRIALINFKDGQRVKRGQLLVQIDDTLQQAQLQQAEAQAAIARTNLQRSRELQAQGFVSPSAVDQNLASLQVAEAQTALARAQLARMKLLAPFDATAGIKVVAVGDYLKDGADVVNLEDLSSMAVEFRLPERYLARVKPSQLVEVNVDAMPGRMFKGQVEALDVQVDANGRSILVRARVDNPDAVLRPGMFARPRLVFAQRERALVVPEEALVPLGTKQYVFKVEDDGKGGQRARRIEARLGLRIPGKVELLDGLVAGDRVVTAGHGRLARSESAPVRVVTLAGAPGAAASGAGRKSGLPGARPAASGVGDGAGPAPASAPGAVRTAPQA